MSSRPPAIDQLARTLGQRLPRRSALRAAAGVLVGGAAGAAASAPAMAAGVRRTVCRRDGVGCTRDAQCCVGQCRTGRDHPRPLRNRCGCRPGYDVCDDDVCTDIGRLDRCGSCYYACPAELADACTDGACMCGAGQVCDGKIADECVSGACQCGDGPTCTPDTELCISGACLSGDCVLVSGAAMCVVDTELNVYQLSPGSQFTAGDCTSSSECASFMLGCGSGWTCFCGAFLRTQPDGPPTPRGRCDAFLTEKLIV